MRQPGALWLLSAGGVCVRVCAWAVGLGAVADARLGCWLWLVQIPSGKYNQVPYLEVVHCTASLME